MGRKIKKNVITKEKNEVHMTDNPLKDSNELESIQTEIDKARMELEQTKREIEETKQQMKLMPNREIDADEQRIIDKQITRGNEKASLTTKIEKQKAYDNVLVTGKFMNRRAPGQNVKLPYIKYNTDPVKWYVLEDGKIYTLPRGFVDQLNGGTEEDPCYYTPHFVQKQGEMDPNKPQSAIHAVDTSNKKYAFVPMNF